MVQAFSFLFFSCVHYISFFLVEYELRSTSASFNSRTFRCHCTRPTRLRAPFPPPSRLFGIKCAKCNMGFCSSDLVMRARDNVYHMECFRCSVCSRHLLPGDEFSLRDDELLCRADHGLLLERASAGSPLSPGNVHSRPLHISGGLQTGLL